MKAQLEKVCAWCSPKKGPNITHVICKECFEKEMEKLDAEDLLDNRDTSCVLGGIRPDPGIY